MIKGTAEREADLLGMRVDISPPPLQLHVTM